MDTNSESGNRAAGYLLEQLDDILGVDDDYVLWPKEYDCVKILRRTEIAFRFEEVTSAIRKPNPKGMEGLAFCNAP